MSFYDYKHEGRRFTADAAAMKDAVFVTAQPTNVPLHGMLIPNADVPTVAAELLKVAGHDYLAGYIEADIDCRERAEAEAAEKKLQERRDALAKDLSDSYWDYEGANMPTKRAIDRIIELEDGASRD